MEKRFAGIRRRALLMLLAAAVLGTFPLLFTQSKYVWKEEIHIQLKITCNGASQDGASVEEEAGLLTEQAPQPGGDGRTEPDAAVPEDSAEAAPPATEGAPAEDGAPVPEEIPPTGEQTAPAEPPAPAPTEESAPEEDSSPAVTVPAQDSIPAPDPLPQEEGAEPVPPEPVPPETAPAGNAAPTE